MWGTEEEGVMSGGQQNRPRPDVDELATLDIGDDVADDEALLPLEVPAGYSLVSSAYRPHSGTRQPRDSASAWYGLGDPIKFPPQHSMKFFVLTANVSN